MIAVVNYVIAARPSPLNFVIADIQGRAVPPLETLRLFGKRLTECDRLARPATAARGSSLTMTADTRW